MAKAVVVSDFKFEALHSDRRFRTGDFQHGLDPTDTRVCLTYQAPVGDVYVILPKSNVPTWLKPEDFEHESSVPALATQEKE